MDFRTQRLQKRARVLLGPLFFQMADQSRDVYCLRSLDFNIWHISAAFLREWGYALEEIEDNPSFWQQLIFLDDRDRVRQAWMEWQAQEEDETNHPRHIEYRIRCRNGEMRWVQETVSRIQEKRKLLGFLSIIRDVTAERSVRDQRGGMWDFFHECALRANMVFWVRDAEFQQFLYVSPSAERILGITPQRLHENPHHWFELIEPADREQLMYPGSTVKMPQRSAEEWENRFRIQRAKQVRFMREIYFPVYAEEGDLRGYAGIVEDMTPIVLRDRKEKSLQQAKIQAEQANIAKTDFLSVMGHEVRTPLHAILGMSQVLSANAPSTEYVDQLEVISQSSRSILGLVDDLLDLAKLETGNFTIKQERLDLQQLIEEVIANFTPAATAKGLTLQMSWEEEVPSQVYGDTKRIEQILSNLVSNAIKFTERGYVKLKVSCLQRTRQEATLCLTVEDTGIGIEKNKLKDIFSKTESTDSFVRNHYGIGFSLVLVKEFVERMGGSIAVTSEIGVGSHFSCIIPFALSNVEHLTSQVITMPAINRARVSSDEDRRKNMAHYPRANILNYAAEESTAPIVMPDRLQAAVGSDTESPKGSHYVGKSYINASSGSRSKLEQRLTALKARTSPKARNTVKLGCIAARVLVVEDNLINQKIARLLLEQFGCEVTVVSRADAAVARALDGFDIILMDIGLPDMDGIEATRLIRERESGEAVSGARLPIVAMTAHVFAQDRQRCFEVGMDEVVSKPVMREELFEVLSRWVKHKVVSQ
ncbi:MAG: hypothetical protein A3J38_01330 [Gammaproteobacteria bacterium RIFCSPHIGHO2_12_FULL_45_9]|nr:MAG: hypothetical protein A3J38_01330 [Gammaproteobacteria bacterium RIFCSPHIGHO2_12_FULL_45_9]